MTSTKKITKIMHNWEEYEVWWGWYSTVIVTLTSGWRSNNSQTVNVTGVTADSTVIVSPEPNSISDYTDCGVYCSGQWNDTLTFSCSSTPTNNIVVNCVVMNEGNVIVMEIPLKSYEEIVAIGNCVDIVNELNQHPLEYLNSLTAEWHIYRTYSEIMYIDLLTNTSDSDRVYLRESSSSSRTFNIWYAEWYKEWTYWSPAVIPELDL